MVQAIEEKQRTWSPAAPAPGCLTDEKEIPRGDKGASGFSLPQLLSSPRLPIGSVTSRPLQESSKGLCSFSFVNILIQLEHQLVFPKKCLR